MNFTLRSLFLLPLLFALASCKTQSKRAGELGYVYIVYPGDTIQDIAAAYREHGVEVTAEQIIHANPQVKFLGTTACHTTAVGERLFVPITGDKSAARLKRP